MINNKAEQLLINCLEEHYGDLATMQAIINEVNKEMDIINKIKKLVSDV